MNHCCPQRQSWLLAVVILEGCLVGAMGSSWAEAASAEPGLIGHYYGNRDFWYYGGSLPLPALALARDMNTLPWPAQNWDASKGPLFQRGGGWSLAVYGALQVEKPGVYRFLADGNATELQLAGHNVPLDGTGSITLPAGKLPLRMYVKSDTPLKDWNAVFRVAWQTPGTSLQDGIPPALLSHTAEDDQRTDIFAPDLPLTNPQIRFYHRRDYEVNLPRDGFYEIAGHFPDVPREIEIKLDGHFLYHHLQCSQTDPAGPSDYHFGFLNESRVVRYLPKGPHSITISGYKGTYVFDDLAIGAFFGQSRFGVSLVTPADPAATLTVYAKNREDLVFRQGESLVVRVEQATQAAAGYTMQVVRQRGDGTVIWSGKTQLPAQTPHAVGEIRYPCNQEGAFEYTIQDAAGRVVEGPWALVVVNPTPLPLPPAAAPGPEMRKVLVDSVDCTQLADAEHHFRDNGTSRVVQGPAGAYRVTGSDYVTYPAYRLKQPGPGLIPAGPAEAGTVTYQAMDWFAYTLHVQHPGKAHLVVAYIPNDVKRLVSVWGCDPVTSNYNGTALEAGNAPASPAFSPLVILMYPNTNTIDVLTIYDERQGLAEDFLRQGAISKLELYELPDGLAPLPRPASGFAPGKEFGWSGEQVNLGLEERMMPSLWKGNPEVASSLPYWQVGSGPYYDWQALATTWDRFGQLSRWRGDHFLVYPVNSYSMGRMGELAYMERDDEAFTGTYNSRLVDPMRRDQFKMMLLLCQKYGVKFVADFEMGRWYQDALLATDATHKYTADGLYVTNIQGEPAAMPYPVLNPAHPLSRQYLVHWVEEIAQQYGSYPAFQGINIRQSGWNSNNSMYFYNINWGYDDFTVGLFEQETGHQVPVTSTGPDRFALRRDYLLQNLKQEWLQWRCDKVTSLRQEMLTTLRKYAPQARLYSGVDEKLFALDSGSGLDPRLQGNRDLGYGQVVRPAGPHIECGVADPVGFANFDIREPASGRRTLDNTWGQSGGWPDYPSNLCAGAGATVRPYPYELEPLAKALADREIHTVEYGGPWVLPPVDDGLRRWAQAWQAIPDLHYTRFANSGQTDQPLVCWQAQQGGSLTAYLVNVTPYARRAKITFAGNPARVTDLVSGATLGRTSTVTVTVDPYMVLPLSAAGATGVEKIEAIVDPQRLASLEAQIRFLQSVASPATGVSHVVPGGGAPYVVIKVGTEQVDDGPWGRRDVTETFNDLLQPILIAWQHQDYTQVEQLLAELRSQHSWWYEAFGWPPGQYAYAQPTGPFATPQQLQAALTAPGAVTVGKVAGVPGDSLSLPGGSASLRWTPSAAGKYAITAWMLSGAGYGPVEVSVDGRPAGRLGVGEGAPYFAHFTVASPLALGPGPHTLAFQSQGAQGLVVSALEIAALPPEPIKQWSVIGLFDKGGTTNGFAGFDTVFPPEKEFNAQASYPGMGGQPIHWQQINIGQDKFIQLLERYFPYNYAVGNGVAYLANWVYSPDDRYAALYYAFDWYSRVWVNDAVVIQAGNGPWGNYTTTTIHLHAGWNKLLIKTSCGRSSWKTNLAVSDPGDLKYSPLPPG